MQFKFYFNTLKCFIYKVHLNLKMQATPIIHRKFLEGLHLLFLHCPKSFLSLLALFDNSILILLYFSMHLKNLKLLLSFKILQFLPNMLMEYLQHSWVHNNFEEDDINPKMLFIQDLIFQLLYIFDLLNFTAFIWILLAFFLLKVV